MEKIALAGGGGHARVLIDLLRALERYEIAGIVDPGLETGSAVSGITVLGDDALLTALYGKGISNLCIAIGSIGRGSKRKDLYGKARHIGFHVPLMVHPRSIVSKEARIAEGAQVMAGAIVQAGSMIGANTIINTGAIIEHDCGIGSHAHICPGAVISGGCVIGEGAFIGAGATVIQGVRIGPSAVVGAGAVVIGNVPDGATVMGVPAK